MTLYIEQGSVNTYIADRVQINSVDMDVNWDNGVLPNGMAGGIDVFDYYLLRRNNAWIVAAKKTISYAASATETTPTLALIELPQSLVNGNRSFFQTYVEDIAGSPAFTISSAAVKSNNEFFTTFYEDISGTPSFDMPAAAVKSNNGFFTTFYEDISGTPSFDMPGAAVKSNNEFFNNLYEEIVGEPAFDLPASQVRSKVI
jgi:hypothetical protein